MKVLLEREREQNALGRERSEPRGKTKRADLFLDAFISLSPAATWQKADKDHRKLNLYMGHALYREEEKEGRSG